MNNEQQIREEWYRTKFSTNNGDESARISEDFEMKDAADFWLNKMEEALSHQKAELRESIEALGHQQDDDTIWCNMDEVLKLLSEPQI